MATFCKTSKGGFNLEQVTDWFIDSDGVLFVNLVSSVNRDGSLTIPSSCDEAKRLISILEGVCIFDTTQVNK